MLNSLSLLFLNSFDYSNFSPLIYHFDFNFSTKIFDVLSSISPPLDFPFLSDSYYNSLSDYISSSTINSFFNNSSSFFHSYSNSLRNFNSNISSSNFNNLSNYFAHSHDLSSNSIYQNHLLYHNLYNSIVDDNYISSFTSNSNSFLDSFYDYNINNSHNILNDINNLNDYYTHYYNYYNNHSDITNVITNSIPLLYSNVSNISSDLNSNLSDISNDLSHYQVRNLNSNLSDVSGDLSHYQVRNLNSNLSDISGDLSHYQVRNLNSNLSDISGDVLDRISNDLSNNITHYFSRDISSAHSYNSNFINKSNLFEQGDFIQYNSDFHDVKSVSKDFYSKTFKPEINLNIVNNNNINSSLDLDSILDKFNSEIYDALSVCAEGVHF